MNRKIQFLSILILGVLIPSIYFSALTKAVVATDQLELTIGSSVEGKVLYSNSTVNDELMYYATLLVADIFNETSTLKNVVVLNHTWEIPTDTENPMGFEDIATIKMTSLIWEHNRTTALPAVTFYLANSSWSLEMTTMYGASMNKMEELVNYNNTKLTFGNGTQYIYGNMEPDDFGYTEVTWYMFIYLLFNYGLQEYWWKTPFAITPTANVGDTIRYWNLNTADDDLAPVLAMPTITTSTGEQIETIHVQYEYTTTYGLNYDADTLDAYYDAKTGLLIRSLEAVGTETYEFVPGEVDIKRAGFLPFPFVGVIVSFVAIGLVAVFVSKKKK